MLIYMREEILVVWSVWMEWCYFLQWFGVKGCVFCNKKEWVKRVKDFGFFQLFGLKQLFFNFMGEEEFDGDGWIWGGRFGMVVYSMGGKSDVYFCISIFIVLQSVVWDLYLVIGIWY